MPHSGLQAVIYVDPLKIKYKCNIRGEDAGLNTLFRPGNWGQERFSFEDVLSSDPRYISCRELMEANLPIEHTHEYATMIDRLERRGKVRGLKSPSAILQYLEGIRRMYRQVVREKRLRSQRELGQPAYGNEINFAIGRDGELLKTDNGNHRLAIARLMRLRKIPAQVSVIHADLLAVLRSLNEHDLIAALNLYLVKVQERYRFDPPSPVVRAVAAGLHPALPQASKTETDMEMA